MASSANATNAAQRGRWSTKTGFMLAAAGSAIGLGNIWRYPAVAYENGGGAFLLPYFIVLATAGIPLLILEYGLGNRSGRGAPRTFRLMNRNAETLGWWQVGAAFFIMTYYIVVLAWAISYFAFSFTKAWGADTEAFFYETYLGMPENIWEIGGLNLKVLVPLAIVWALVYLILLRGVSKGIELASRIAIPTLVVMLILLVIRGVTLPGAGEGLSALFTPDFSALGNPSVWVAAVGQIFFSLSIGFATMIAYSSYLERKTDLPNTAAIVGLANASFEFIAAIAVFGVIGFLAQQQNVPVADAVQSGPGLTFVTYPQILNEMPLGALFGVIFFATLFLAGLTSAVSVMEPGIAALREKFHLGRTRAVLTITITCTVVSLLYATGSGLYFLDIVDHFVNSYAVAVSGLFEIVLVAWILRQIGPLRNYLNEYAYLKVGRLWTVGLTMISPVLLGAMTVVTFVTVDLQGYEGYPRSALFIVGIGVLVLIGILALVFTYIRDEAVTPAEAATRK